MNIHVSNTGSLRENTDLSIMEAPLEWLRAFQDNWLDHLEKTGETNWSVYTRVTNKFPPSGKAVQLHRSRLLFVTSIGAYLPGQQAAFNNFNPLGDYTIRQIPSRISLEQLEFSHSRFDQTAVRRDAQTLLPLRHLENLTAEGRLGSLAPEFISFQGYHPHAIRVVKELIPTILEAALTQEADAALLIPVGPLCVQSCGLVARALEVNGIATTIITSQDRLVRLTAPPRATVSPYASSAVLGAPHNLAQQRRTLEVALSLLEKEAPLDFVRL